MVNFEGYLYPSPRLCFCMFLKDLLNAYFYLALGFMVGFQGICELSERRA